MVKDLVFDEAILSQVCEAATADDAGLAQDLVDTLLSIEDAACIAANQIGVTKALIAYLDDDDEPHVMYNPKLKRALQPERVEESCLTREGEVKVTRFGEIQVAYDDLIDGELKPRKRRFHGWTAEIIQHGIDHCKGKLI